MWTNILYNNIETVTLINAWKHIVTNIECKSLQSLIRCQIINLDLSCETNVGKAVK